MQFHPFDRCSETGLRSNHAQCPANCSLLRLPFMALETQYGIYGLDVNIVQTDIPEKKKKVILMESK